MLNFSTRRLFGVVLALTAWAIPSAFAFACPFCTMQGLTLTGEVKEANMVLFGTLANAKPDLNDFGGGTTDLIIESVLKKDPVVADKKVITLPRYVPVTKTDK